MSGRYHRSFNKIVFLFCAAARWDSRKSTVNNTACTIVWFTHQTFPAENIAVAKQVYIREVATVVRELKGNQDTMLLEPKEVARRFISQTFRETEEDLKAFEASRKL